MAGRLNDGFQLLKKTGDAFWKHDCMSMAAAMAYYTVFSLPPLIVILLVVTGFFVDSAQIEEQIDHELRRVVGEGGVVQMHEMIEGAERGGHELITSIIGVVVLIFGATGVMGQLQAALNRTWSVAPDPQQGGLINFIVKRVLSLGMILVIAFLLLVSLVLSTALTMLGSNVERLLPGNFWEPLLWTGNLFVSFAMIGLLFAAIFKFMPDAKIAWRDVWVGAVATAVLFMIGNFLIGLYLGKGDIGETYGAAASLVLILVWVYYSSLILLVGAEFTQVWARRHGKQIDPATGAVRVVQETHEVRSDVS